MCRFGETELKKKENFFMQIIEKIVLQRKEKQPKNTRR